MAASKPPHDLQALLTELAGLGSSSEAKPAHHLALDESAAIAAASQYVARELQPVGTGKSASQDASSPPQEVVAHTLNRLLIKNLVVPLTDSERPDYIQLLSGSESTKTQVSITQALQTLEATIKSSPKLLEHLFASDPQHGANRAPELFKNTTFDVWAAPRMLSAAAAVAAFLARHHHQSQGNRDELIDYQLPFVIIQRLSFILSTSLDSLNQVDNVRLVLLEALRVSVQALSCVGHPSFLPGFTLPSIIMSGWSNAVAMSDGQTNEPLTFFRQGPYPEGFSLSSRDDRPRPLGSLIRGLDAAHSTATFTFKMASTSQNSQQIFATATAMLLAAVQLCLDLSARFPGQLQDLGDHATRLLASNWDYQLSSSKTMQHAAQIPPRLQAWRLQILSQHLVPIVDLFPGTAIYLASIYGRCLLDMVDITLEEELEYGAHGSVAASPTTTVQEAVKAVAETLASHFGESGFTEVKSSLLRLLGPRVPFLVHEVTENTSPEMLETIDNEAQRARVKQSLASRKSIALTALVMTLETQSLENSRHSKQLRLLAEKRLRPQDQNRVEAASDVEHNPNPDADLEWMTAAEANELLAVVSRASFEPFRVLGKRKASSDQNGILAPAVRSSSPADVVELLGAQAVQHHFEAVLPTSVLRKESLAWLDDSVDIQTIHYRFCLEGYLACARAGALEVDQSTSQIDVPLVRGLQLLKPHWACHLCDASPAARTNQKPRSSDVSSLTTVHLWLQRTVLDPAQDQEYGPSYLEALRRMLNHTIGAQLGQDKASQEAIGLVVSVGLRNRRRATRIAAGRLAAAVVGRALALRASMGENPFSQGMVSEIIQATRRPIESSDPKLQETAILALAMLARFDHDGLRERSLLDLILQLSNPNPFLKALAHTQILQLASHNRCTTFQLLRPHLRAISTTIVERFNSMPDLWMGMLNLIKMSQKDFFNATLEFTLPHLISMICKGKAVEGRKMVDLIARAMGVNVAKMCLNQITAIFKHFFLQPPSVRDAAFRVLLDLISLDSANLKSLLRSRQHEVVGHLVIKLGNQQTRQNAWDGLVFITETIRDSSMGQQPKVVSQDTKMRVADFLQNEILAILDWINHELVGEHGKRSISERAHAAQSIGALVEIIGPPISAVTPQITATLNSILQESGLATATLKSWETFIVTLRFDAIGPFIGQTAAALLAAWSNLDAAARKIATSILEYLVVGNSADLLNYIKDIPSLDSLESEIPLITRKLRSLREAWNADKRFSNILERAGHENSTICLQSLHELRSFLSDESEYIQGLVSGDAFNPMIGDCIRTLLAAAGRGDSMQDDIRRLSFECLGAIGAVDPDRFDHQVDEPIRTLLHNFEDADESAEFGVHLIRDLLVPAFRATDDTNYQSALAYAIQELLKFCGFKRSLVGPGNAGRQTSVKVKQRWDDLPQATLDTVTPLLDSKYVVHVGRLTVRPVPIYLHTHSYREWIQGWANQLISGITGEMAQAVFGVFRIAIRDQDISIARHILPHVVLHTLVFGSDKDRENVQLEFNAVLADQVDTNTDYEPERKLLSAQTVFGLMDHIGVWLRKKRQDVAKQSKRNRNLSAEDALSAVESLTSSISQELMAQASMQCKAYARSLLNFEQRIRTLKTDGGRQDADLQNYYENLHQIYAFLDEPDGMEGISTKVISPSLEHQIREHESTGRWTSAQSCWEVKLQQKPDDASLHLGLLRCLRNLGHYDTMRTHIRGALSVHPEWESLLASFQIEGACILGDWGQVEELLSRHGNGGDSPEHGIGRTILSMRKLEPHEFEQSLTDVRLQLAKPIVAAGRGSYGAMYDVVLQLHMLHELKMIRDTRYTSNPSPKSAVENLNKALQARLDATLPSFRTREPLLSMRRTAFAAISSGSMLKSEIGTAWISTAKIARRAGHRQTAYSAMLQASQWQAPFAFVQRVKLLALDEQTHKAIQELNNSLSTLSATFRPGQIGDGKSTGPILVEADADSDVTSVDRSRYAKACLLRARLLDSTLRFQPAEILERYKEAAKEQTHSEKMWYYLGHFQDIHEGLLPSQALQRYNVCRSLLRSVQLGTKFFYRALPRVLTIWMDLGGDPAVLSASKATGNTKQSAEAQDKINAFNNLNMMMQKYSKRLRAFQWLAVFPQLVARIVHKNGSAWIVLQEIILQVLFAFPHQAMWSLVAGSNSKDSERKKRFNEIVAKVNAKSSMGAAHKDVARIVYASQKLAKELLRLCDFDVRGESNTLSVERQFPGLMSIASSSQLLLPLQSSMTVHLPANNLVTPEHRPFAHDLPLIQSIEDQIDVINSLQKPRKIVFVGNNGKRYSFLCKPKDDLRKDARLMEFDSMINKLLQSNAESRKRKLYVRTYAVLILNEEHGLIEWVPHTVGLRHILTRQYNARGIPIYTHDIRKDMDQARLSADAKETERIFETMVLPKFPPVFHEWFLATFPEPSAWLKARSSYARTAAVMSMVGFVLGLGDRHGENILFDANSGDTVHVDLNCLFDKGQKFEIPERVPFRLTHNMVDAFGVTGCDGIFRKSAEVTMAILRDNRDSLMSVLEAMVHDPLGEWGAPEDRSRKSVLRPDPRIAEARRALDPVASKLDGRIYRAGEREPTPPYSTPNLVDSLIKEATSPVNLAKMYVGWSSWL